jgi:hypothetical protein
LRNWLVAGCAIVLFGIVAALFAPSPWIRRVGPIRADEAFDVAIFYCAGRSLGHGDPYAIEPLTTCEHRFPKIFYEGTVPSPQPGYMLPVLALGSELPEPRFAFAWIVAIAGLAACAAGVLARLTRFPAFGIFLALLLGPGFENLYFGQLSMPVVFAVVCAAYALRAGNARAAALWLTPGLVEPHLALPAFLALFVLVPRSRLTVLGIGAVAAAISLVTIGPALSLEYVTRVLPLQALAEARNVQQYSMTLLATMFGASDTLAVRLGDVQYALFAAASVYAALLLRRRFDDPAFIVAIPVAGAVIGGPYVHFSQYLVVWPAALLLGSYATGRMRWLAFGVVALLAFPWRENAALPTRLIVDAGVAGLGYAVALCAAPARRVAVWAAFTLPVVGLSILIQHVPQAPILSIPSGVPAFFAEAPWGVGLSSMPWGVQRRLAHHVLTQYELAMKVPSLLMLVLLVVFVVILCRGIGRAPRMRDAIPS